MVADPRTYPLPRRKRVGPSSSLEALAAANEGAVATPPRARVFPWVMNLTATSRRTLSTPLLQGPALLRKCFIFSGTVSTPPQQTLEFGWSVNPVTENGVAIATVRPYTVLTEYLDPFAVSASTIGMGFPAAADANSHVKYEYSLDLIVTEPRFCFTVSWLNIASTAEQRSGHLLVLEAVNLDALSTFLGS
jgi:hypothetical protein